MIWYRKIDLVLISINSRIISTVRYEFIYIGLYILSSKRKWISVVYILKVTMWRVFMFQRYIFKVLALAKVISKIVFISVSDVY